MSFSKWQRPKSSASCTNGNRKSEIGNRTIFLILISGFCFLISDACEAGAWTQPQGKWQLITAAGYYTTATYKDNAGRTLPQARFTKYEFNPYLEYGLSDNLTLGGDTFLDYVTQSQATRDENIGVADTELFARWRLWRNERYVLSVQPLVKLPSYYESKALPRAGERHGAAELSLQGGAAFKALGREHFLEIDTGYRFRAANPHDQLRANLTLGFNVAERWTLMPQLFAIWRTEHDPATAFVQSGDNDFNLVRGQLSALYKVEDDVSIQMGAFSHLYARNTGLGSGVMVSVWKYF